MTGKEFRELRLRLRMGVVEFGRALGYVGRANTISVKVRRYERADEVPPPVALRARNLMEDAA